MVTGAGLFTAVGGTLAAGATVAIGYSIAAIVINLAISALLGKLLAPRASKSGRDAKGLQKVIRSNIKPRRILYGAASTGGPYALVETGGSRGQTSVNNEMLHMVVVLTGHPVEDIVGIRVDDVYIDISGEGGATNTASNDLDEDYWVDTGRYGTGIAENHIRIIKNNGWGYADLSYVTDGDRQEAQDDRARGVLIETALLSAWPQPGGVRDTGTGLYGSGSKLTNCAYIFIRVRFNQDVWSGFPELKFHVKGKRLYNPYKDPTNHIAIGADSSGTQVFGDPDTYEWSEDWTLSVLDYLIHPKYGLGAKTSGDLIEVDWSEAIQSHIASSEIVTNGLPTPYTGTSSKYTTNGVFETSATPISSMESLLTSGAGSIVYSQGKHKIRPGIYRAPNSESDIINEGMIVGPLSIRTHTPRAEIFNKVSGIYVTRGTFELQIISAENPPMYEPADFGLVSPIDSSGNNPYEVADGEEIIKEFDFPFTTSEFEAQRLARILLERVRSGMTISFNANLEILKFSVGDTVYLEILSDSIYANEAFYNKLGLNDSVQNQDSPGTSPYYKQFQITEMQYNNDFTIAVSMIEEMKEIYEWNDGFASHTDNALASEIIADDPTGEVLPPSFIVDSPYETIVENIATTSGTTVTTEVRWSSTDRGSVVSALDEVHVSYYTVEYGEITNPSAVGEGRVDVWIPGGGKSSLYRRTISLSKI
jgi:hypothetical protein